MEYASIWSVNCYHPVELGKGQGEFNIPRGAKNMTCMRHYKSIDLESPLLGHCQKPCVNIRMYGKNIERE